MKIFFFDAMQGLSVKERTGMRSRAQSCSSLLKMMIIFRWSRLASRNPIFVEKGIFVISHILPVRCMLLKQL